MEPTLSIASRVVIGTQAPFVGSIVVSNPPREAEQQLCGPKPHEVRPGGAACDVSLPTKSNTDFIKRIVAGPGDEIYVRAGHVYRRADGTSKFVREHDRYAAPCGDASECDFPTPIKIPAGHWFLMGDNRGESDDSRYWGRVPTAWIVGVAREVECGDVKGHRTWVHRAWWQGCPPLSKR